MNIYVLVKRVPDTESKIRINHETNSIMEEGLNFVLNPYDEYAVEEALRIKEGQGAKVTVVSVGTEEALVVLKKCLAMGADEAVLIKDSTEEAYDGLRTARIIDQAFRTKFSDHSLLLFGKQSVDADNSQIPSMVAELLSLPQVNVVTRLKIEGNRGTAHREIEGATEKVSFPLPAVISAQKGLNEPRYETLKGIMMAKKKEIPVISVQELDLKEEDLAGGLEVMNIQGPPVKEPGKVVEKEPAEAAKELVDFLHQEAKII
ncbi:MAG: electron transfer flavoprotein subunit beta/FixA family protein [Candidatus Aminicenantes bacterium]